MKRWLFVWTYLLDLLCSGVRPTVDLHNLSEARSEQGNRDYELLEVSEQLAQNKTSVWSHGDPIPGSNAWEDGCLENNAYACDNKMNCCCNTGCKYSKSKQKCHHCRHNEHVKAVMIPKSDTWGPCRVLGSSGHTCGKGCCCNRALEWNGMACLPPQQPQTQKPQAQPMEAEASPDAPLDQANATKKVNGKHGKVAIGVRPIPGSNRWILGCSSNGGHECGANGDCCCNYGCTYNPKEDQCDNCMFNAEVERNMVPGTEGHRMCDTQLVNTHKCGKGSGNQKGCCCNRDFIYDVPNRRCSKAAVGGSGSYSGAAHCTVSAMAAAVMLATFISA